MLRLMVRLLPVIVCLSVFPVFVSVLPVAGQSDRSRLPQSVEHQVATGQSPANPLLYTTPPFAAAQFDPWELATTAVAAQAPSTAKSCV